MKLKGVTEFKLTEITAFWISLISLLPIFQARLDIVAEWKLMLCRVTFLVTGSWSAASLIELSEQGKLRPVRYIESSGYAGCMGWAGCCNSCFKVDDNENIVFN